MSKDLATGKCFKCEAEIEIPMRAKYQHLRAVCEDCVDGLSGRLTDKRDMFIMEEEPEDSEKPVSEWRTSNIFLAINLSLMVVVLTTSLDFLIIPQIMAAAAQIYFFPTKHD